MSPYFEELEKSEAKKEATELKRMEKMAGVSATVPADMKEYEVIMSYLLKKGTKTKNEQNNNENVRSRNKEKRERKEYKQGKREEKEEKKKGAERKEAFDNLSSYEKRLTEDPQYYHPSKK